MSGLNMENDMSYLSEMSEDDRVTFLKVLARLAKTDGNVDEGERAFIIELGKAFGVSQSRAEEIRLAANDDTVVEEAKKIKNRRVAMELIKEMCMLANSDGDLSDRETLLIGRVGKAMGLELEKIEQIVKLKLDGIARREQALFERENILAQIVPDRGEIKISLHPDFAEKPLPAVHGGIHLQIEDNILDEAKVKASGGITPVEHVIKTHHRI